MLNYVKSEMYRVARIKSTYTILLVCLLIPLFPLVFCWYLGLGDLNFLYNNTKFVFGFARNSLGIVLFVLPFVVNSLFADEHQNGTFKNSVAYGVKRETLYFGKLILSSIVSIMISMIILLIFIPGAEILLQNSGAVYRNEFIADVFHSVPLFLTALTLSHMLSFITKKSSTHIGIYIFIITLLPNILGQLTVVISVPEMVFRLFPDYLIQVKYWQTAAEWLYCWGVLLLYFMTTTMVGLSAFSKRDI